MKDRKPFSVSADGISEKLNEKYGITVEVRDEVGSTNDELKKAAADEKLNNFLLVARKQTAGRGRIGRKFYSPADSGIYMSLLVRPDSEPEKCTLLTSIAAVAVAEALEEIFSVKADIKWVNDIYIDGRKVSGILTESRFSQGKALFSVVGIGINITESEEGFPDEIKDIAGAVTKEEKADLKNSVIASVVNRFMEYYSALPEMSFAREFDKRLLWKGKKVSVISAQSVYTAEIKGIDEMCHLIVEDGQGTEQTLFSGEISIRAEK